MAACLLLMACSRPAAVNQPSGYAAVAFEFKNGEVVQANVLGGTRKLSTCRDVADKLERDFLADSDIPAGYGLSVVCIPIPPAGPAKGEQKS